MFALRRALPLVRMAPRATFSDAAADVLTLNFSVPHQTIMDAQVVDRVIIPGVEGEYGVTAGHSPVVAQLKPGVVTVVPGGNAPDEKYFVSGGFALTHANSVTDISAMEAVKLEDLDPDAVRQVFTEAKGKFDAAKDEMDKAEAQVAMETSKDMALALGISL